MTADELAPFARIILRYLGGALISAGVALNPALLNDPDAVQVTCIVLGGLCTAISEGWYIIAKKNGWPV